MSATYVTQVGTNRRYFSVCMQGINGVIWFLSMDKNIRGFMRGIFPDIVGNLVKKKEHKQLMMIIMIMMIFKFSNEWKTVFIV